MQHLTPAGQQVVGDLAARYGISTDAATHMLIAVLNGQGSMAQFSHPEFGGSGQWMRGGMTMVGDMFNYGLKNLVDNLCSEISNILNNQPGLLQTGSFQSQSQSSGGMSTGGMPMAPEFLVRSGSPLAVVSGRTGQTQFQWLAEQRTLCLFRKRTPPRGGCRRRRGGLRHPGPPDRRFLAAAGLRRIDLLQQSVRHGQSFQSSDAVPQWTSRSARSPEPRLQQSGTGTAIRSAGPPRLILRHGRFLCGPVGAREARRSQGQGHRFGRRIRRQKADLLSRL